MKTLTRKITVETEVYDSFESLEFMQPQWDEFVEAVGCEVFMTYDWLRIWWKYYGENRLLRIFVFRSEGELVGIIPLFFEKIRIGPFAIKCGKIVGTDFTMCAITLPVYREFLPLVIENFLAEVKASCSWDILHIGPLSAIYDDFGNIFTLFGRHSGNGYRVKEAGDNVQTFFLLTGFAGEPAELITKKHKRNIRKKYNNLSKLLANNTPITSHFASDADFEEIFENFTLMHQQHWENQNQMGHFGDWPASLEFHRDEAIVQLKCGRLRMLEVSADGQTLGYKYAYKFGNTLVEFLDARVDDAKLSRAGLGNIIFYEQLKMAKQERVSFIDSLRGKYEHKLRMGGKLFDINNIYIFPNGLFKVAKVSIFRLFARLLNIFYYKIWFSRLAPKLHLRRRPLWKVWIRSTAFADCKMSEQVKTCHGQSNCLRQSSLPIAFGNVGKVLWRLRAALSHLLWHLKTKGSADTLKLIALKTCRIAGIRKPVNQANLAKSGEQNYEEVLNLRQGELVEVKSESEIAATLDDKRCNRGLLWMANMRKFCGHRYRVFKRLDTMLLESDGQMRKMKNTVLLENVYCDGTEFSGCDRSCFHYWREAWLKRVDDA